MEQLLDMIDVEGSQLEQDFALASRQASGTPQEIADFRENRVQDFIKRFYPRSFVVTKGKITDIDGNQSASIDCIVLNPSHPNFIDSRDKFKLIIADGCDHAIEVKPDLARQDEIHRALKQCISTKKIKRTVSSIIIPQEAPAHILEHSFYINFVIFSISAFSPKKMHQLITEYYQLNQTPLEMQIDAVFILGQGILKHFKHRERNLYGAPPPVGGTPGWYFEKWDRSSLAGLLFQMETAYISQPTGWNQNIIYQILKKHLRFSVEYLGPIVEPT